MTHDVTDLSDVCPADESPVCFFVNPLTKGSGSIFTPALKKWCDEHDMWWLVDEICDHQPVVCNHPQLFDFQDWTLRIQPNGEGELSARDRSGESYFQETLPYCEAPSSVVSLMMTRGVMPYLDSRQRSVFVLSLPDEQLG